MSWIGEIIGSGVGKAIGEAATPFTNAWIETKKSAAATHTIDKQTDRDITLASFQADVQLGLAQQSLAAADQTNWSTRWIRPAFSALAFVWMAWSVWLWIANGVALADVVQYLLAGIVAAIFVLRPFEKGKRADIVNQAQQAPAASLRDRVAGAIKGKQ